MDLGDGLGPLQDQYVPRRGRRGITSMSVFPSVERIPEASTYIHSVEDLTLPPPRRIAMSSSDPSADPPSIFDTDDNDPDASSSASSRTSNGFDLMPPPPNVTLTNAEVLSVRLFSTDHLNLIIHHQPFFSQFIAFLNEYRPNYAPTLIRYLETLKAAAAVDYANAIARQIVGPEKTSSASLVAATLSSKFGSGSRRVAEQLVNEALPGYITFRLTNVVTELLINEITGCSAAGSRNLVCGLAEAYCLTDPSRPGNPIVYASEGFHTTTLYGRDFVLGRNCRFLQGPKSSRATISRIGAAVRNGQEQSELLLNYRRDGSPFLNLCLIAPLHDNRGNVRYFIGCQIDVTNLVERCQGLDSFQMLLEQDQQAHQHEVSAQQQEKDALEALGRLGELLSLEEMETIRSKGRPGSDSRSATPARGNRPLASNTQLRRYVNAEDSSSSEGSSARLRATNRLNPSGRFPNAYETFMLVRPYPSLRITFTSPALRIPGLLQSRLLDRIGGPHTVREFIRTSLADGARITAKVNWLTNSGHRKTPSTDRAGRPHVDIHGRPPPHYSTGKPRWIHCTPMYGADGNIGVWMVVMVDPDENETHNQSTLRAPTQP
ncbi:PAS domain-containing protein [Phyllosticta capitalensis]|uniref:PAS domain-containing protein n=1 Tax=Phyllosticta capitalensis TaxID=121624 RepID=A0ABR1YUT2_9PEZI